MGLSFPKQISSTVKEYVPPAVRTGATVVADQAKAMKSILKAYGAETLVDTGDTLLDEQEAVVLRRAILNHPGTMERADEKKAAEPLAKSQCYLKKPPDPVGPVPKATKKPATKPASAEKDTRKDASDVKLDKYYAAAHRMGDLSALCLSGGGIRSAAFAFGVVQGLAKRRLLHKFDYLSTVSGGGYFGSFLTAWVQRQGYARVCDELSGKVPPGAPLQYLRGYTSYLTPDRAIFAADMLSVAAIYLRNLFLNWLIIVPLIVAVLIAIKASAVVLWSLPASSLTVALCLLVTVFVGGVGTMESLRQRPGWESAEGKSSQFQFWVKWTIFICGFAACIAALKYLQGIGAPPNSPAQRSAPAVWAAVGYGAAVVSAISFISWMIAYFISRNPKPEEISTRSTVRSDNWAAFGNLVSFTVSGAVAGAFLALVFWFVAQFQHFDLASLVVLSLGPLVVVTAIFLGETIHVGSTSASQWSDGEREWLATAAGYHGRLAVGWALVVLVVFGGSEVVFKYFSRGSDDWLKQVWALGTSGVAGLIIAWLGKASATAATLRERYNTWTNWSASIVLAIATPVFLVTTISFLSAAIDYVFVDKALSFSALLPKPAGPSGAVADTYPLPVIAFPYWLFAKMFFAFAACAVLCLVAGVLINTNRFSLHGLYRNRLIRAFLGGSRDERSPNPLTQFDERDNLNLCDLWPNTYGPQLPSKSEYKVAPKPEDEERYRGQMPPQFLVINCALNVLKSDNLAWQERKALSFSCTPRTVGAAALGDGSGYYRRSGEYGGLHNGISLGTAMTISGAAVSPNMGYHSSPALSVLMTFFNVRLGAWLANPGPAGGSVLRLQGPRFSVGPLALEALGMANEESSYVYLSDGGHFENLGLYEMVRRRCRLIVLSDAGCDPEIAFEDLGNAVRKISIDLNVAIEFDTLKIPPRKTPPLSGSYVATAKIHYPEAGAEPGHLLYIKPSYRGTEPASVRAYAEANPAFPHEPTSDQMFGESQFEAYRALGEYIIQTIDGKSGKPYASIDLFIEAVNAHLAIVAKHEAKAAAKSESATKAKAKSKSTSKSKAPPE